MLTMKNYNTAVVGFFIVFFFARNECSGCFTSNQTHNSASFAVDSSYYMECLCETPVLTTRNLKWLDVNNQEIPEIGPGNKPNVYTERHEHSLNLYIPSLSKSLAGSYKCVSRGPSGEIYAITYEVEAYNKLRFLHNMSETQHITLGRNSLIVCEAIGDTPPIIAWHKGQDDSPEIVSGDKYEITPKGILVKNVSYEDAGIYKCTASVYKTGENADRFVKVEVAIAPEIENIIAVPNKTIVAGSPLVLDCRAKGHPLPEFTWIKTSDKAISNDSISWRQDINRLIFENVTANDRGTYECITKNPAGEAKAEIKVEVYTPPIIVHFQNITVAEGTEVKVTCRASGRPRPLIIMMFEYDVDSSLPYDERETSEIETEFNLSITKVNRSHEGIYYCNASNAVDSVVESMYMSVLYKPFFEEPNEFIWAWEGRIVNLSCDPNSQPPAQKSWSYQVTSNEIPTQNQIDVNKLLLEILNKVSDKDVIPVKIFGKAYYGIYICTAKNNFGNATKYITVKQGFRPSVISSVNITDITATSATFVFIQPQFTGPKILGYTAEYDETDSYNVTNIHFNRTWADGIMYKLDKLKPNTTYSVRFAAINEIGYGPFSAYYDFETPEKSVPEPPTWEYSSDLVQIPAEDRTLKLKSPENNGDPIDYYAVKYCAIDGSTECTERRITPTNELPLNHLDHNTTYHLELIAHNSVGNSTTASLQITIAVPESPEEEVFLSAGVIIAIAIVVVVVGILLLDLLLFLTRKQGMMAICCSKKNKNRKEDSLQSRDKKGLLKDKGESAAGDTRVDNGHKEFEYNKTTGVITGKHSAV